MGFLRWRCGLEHFHVILKHKPQIFWQPFELCSGYMVPVRLSSTGDSAVHIAGVGSVNCKHSSSLLKMTGVTQVNGIWIWIVTSSTILQFWALNISEPKRNYERLDWIIPNWWFSHLVTCSKFMSLSPSDKWIGYLRLLSPMQNTCIYSANYEQRSMKSMPDFRHSEDWNL